MKVAKLLAPAPATTTTMRSETEIA